MNQAQGFESVEDTQYPQGTPNLKSTINFKPVRAGALLVKTANDTLSAAAAERDPEALWTNFWNEGETACLFATSNAGKSLLAVQIGQTIAQQGKDVIYFDFELTNKQFQLRYTREDGQTFHFSDKFMRCEVDRQYMDTNFEQVVIDLIESLIVTTECRVVIIDNLTWLSSTAEKGTEAASLMKRLSDLKFTYNLSMLVVAHTPKRDDTLPITANDLAGSRQLFNFFDAVVALGNSSQDKDLRYLKQLKCRAGSFTNGEDNVMVLMINKNDDGFLGFEELGCEPESAHLVKPADARKRHIIEQMRPYVDQGLSIREIAAKIGSTFYAVRNAYNTHFKHAGEQLSD